MAIPLSIKTQKIYPFTGNYLASFGKVPAGALWLIYGHKGGGKTELAVQLSTYFSRFGRVLYINGRKEDLNDLRVSYMRNYKGRACRIDIAEDLSVDEICTILSGRNAPDFMFLDDIEALNLSPKDFKEIDKARDFSSLICLHDATRIHLKKPDTEISTEELIFYRSDIKVRVDHFVAFPRSRFLGNAPYVIWEEKAAAFFAFLWDKKKKLLVF